MKNNIFKSGIVTGCSKGIGFATTKYLLEKNYKIFARLDTPEFEIIADPNNVRVLRYDFINDETKFKAIRNKSNVDVSHKKINTDLEYKAFRASPMSFNDKKLLVYACV